MAETTVDRYIRATGAPHFKCPDCGAKSFHPMDIEEGYCGACHWWTGHPVMRTLERQRRIARILLAIEQRKAKEA